MSFSGVAKDSNHLGETSPGWMKKIPISFGTDPTYLQHSLFSYDTVI